VLDDQQVDRAPNAQPVDGGWIPHLPEPGYSKSLERGLAILACFTARRPVMGIAELSRELGMYRATTHRYARTLVALGYLEQDDKRKYRLGIRATDLGLAALNATALREHAHQYMRELSQRTACSVSLAVLDRTEIVYLDRVNGTHPAHGIDPPLQPGSRLPACCTALGKMLIAGLPAAEQGELIRRMTLAKQGPKAIKSKKTLSRELDLALERGFAVNDEELAEGLCAIASPVRNQAGQVTAAIAMSAQSSMISLEEMMRGLSPHLASTADCISARIGYRRF